jgi:uncharacterized protein with HEPN domain
LTDLRLDDYLDHIEQAAREALGFVQDHTVETFSADRRTQQAVMMTLVIIGEAATRIAAGYPDFAAQHPEIPWQQIRGMRNRMVHGYFDIDLQVVWATLESAIPQLLIQIQELRKVI